jgi:hypothetical protein
MKAKKHIVFRCPLLDHYLSTRSLLLTPKFVVHESCGAYLPHKNNATDLRCFGMAKPVCAMF